MSQGYDDEGRELPRSRRNPRLRSRALPEDTGRRSGTGQGAGVSGQEAESAAKGASRRRKIKAGSGTASFAAGSSGGDLLQMEEQLRKRKRRRRIITMVVLEVFALVFIAAAGFVARTAARISWSIDDEIDFEEIPVNEISVEAQETMKGYWTVAVFGVDARDNSTLAKNTNSDVIIIASLNRETSEIKLVSVYRDTYLNISENGTYNKINQAYFTGGASQAVAALNRNLDLQIQDYVTFNWKGVAEAINVLGGVDVELSSAEYYYINSFITETVKATGIASVHLTHAGLNHLDGVQAVAYGRLRLMDTDYARTERQRKIIQLAFEKCKEADLTTILTLVGTVFNNVKTSVSYEDVISYAENVAKLSLGETTGFPNQRGEANMVSKGAVVVPATLVSNVTRLHEFLYGEEDYEPSDTVKNISAKIAADTGVYKELQVIDHVGTSGGVIQTSASDEADEDSSASDDDDDEGYQTVYDYDEDGEVITRRLKMEVDEDGNYIEYEVDEDGFLVTDAPVESSSTNRPSALMADDDDDDDDNDDGDDADGGGRAAGAVTSERPGSTVTENAGEAQDEDEEDEDDDENDADGGRQSVITPSAPASAGDPVTAVSEGPSSPTAATAAASEVTVVSEGPGGTTTTTTGSPGVVSAPGQ